MDNATNSAAGESVGTTPVNQDKPAQGRPVIEVPPAMAPNTAQVIVTITQILKSNEATEVPCAHGPCRAIAKVMRVKGYGAGFPAALGDGQTIKLYFPSEMKLPGPNQGMIQEQQVLDLHLRALPAGGEWYTVRSFTLVNN